MIKFHLIRTIARYEMRTLLRSWFFRIFAGLAVIGLGIFNVAVFVPASGAPWMYRALPAAIPYANLIILNLGQAIVAVFLASEFLKQDKKNDTVEVIYARSMTNAEYILGKALGILSVFFILNLVILMMGIGFSFISSDSTQGIWEFFFYPLLISLPTLVFILGLSFFLMILLKNQAITFILLLGYIALTIFYLNTKYYHLFDYIAYQIPMMNSTIGGFGNFNEVLIHRGIYFFFGLGLIFFTVFRLQRLPQSKKMASFPVYLTILCLCLAGFFAEKYIGLKKETIHFKEQMIELNNNYVDTPKVKVISCDIELEHLGKEIAVQANLEICNKTNSKIDTLIFSLNPSLHIVSAKSQGKELKYQRNLHLVLIDYPGGLLSGDSAELSLNYRGTINESTHFLDQDLDEYTDNFSLEMFRIRKRYAYLQNKFVCLTSESLWYPTSGVGYATNIPALHFPDFTKFSLKVKTDTNLVAVSQGEPTKLMTGEFAFKPKMVLPKISLLIADYNKYSISVDSIEYSIYAKDGNQYFLNHFMNSIDSLPDFKDSLPNIIRELKNEYETKIGLEYPFERFILAEIPLHFALDKHIWSVSSDAVQPEIMFYPEKGVILEETDFKKRKKRFERRMIRDNEEVSPAELQSRIFKRFVRGNYMANNEEWYMFDVMDRNTYTLLPNYYSFITQFNSEKWPVLNMSLEAYLKDRNENSLASYRWFFTGVNKGERINLELKEASLNRLLETGIETSFDDDQNENEDIILNDIIIGKGEYLFSVFRARYGEDEFNKFLNRFIEKYKHRSFSFEDFEKEIENKFNENITNEVSNWYSKKELPGFLIKDLQTYKVMEGEFSKYQIRFKISNPEEVDGLITINIDLSDPNRVRRRRQENEAPDFTKKIHIPAKTAKEIGFVFTSEPARMNIYTHISENLPNNLIYDFSAFDEIRKVAVFDEVKNCELYDDILNENEIIVDNESDNFEFTQDLQKSYLKSLIDENKKEGCKYSGIRYWSPPAEWKSVLRSAFYGKYVRSAVYTKSGHGERAAIWEAPLENEGQYDVYCHINKLNTRRANRKSNYNFKVFHDGGMQEFTLSDEELEDGWNYLGTFFISPSNAKVELTNKSIGEMIFADAIKWVNNE
ncbi:MAG: hypothetical protein JEY97_12865 [Bacteroidales bacterium]|nr:hypothetical protein [Bacteroidales bacterium]